MEREAGATLAFLKDVALIMVTPNMATTAVVSAVQMMMWLWRILVPQGGDHTGPIEGASENEPPETGHHSPADSEGTPCRRPDDQVMAIRALVAHGISPGGSGCCVPSMYGRPA